MILVNINVGIFIEVILLIYTSCKKNSNDDKPMNNSKDRIIIKVNKQHNKL